MIPTRSTQNPWMLNLVCPSCSAKLVIKLDLYIFRNSNLLEAVGHRKTRGFVETVFCFCQLSSRETWFQLSKPIRVDFILFHVGFSDVSQLFKALQTVSSSSSGSLASCSVGQYGCRSVVHFNCHHCSGDVNAMRLCNCFYNLQIGIATDDVCERFQHFYFNAWSSISQSHIFT